MNSAVSSAVFSRISSQKLYTILDRLQSVKATGHNQAMACCPAHDDRTPSLSIKETDEGRILIHCFAGCGAADIMDAIGLRLSDLYPQPLSGSISPLKPERRSIKNWLRTVAQAAHRLPRKSLNDEDQSALMGAVRQLGNRIGDSLHHETLIVAVVATDRANGSTPSQSELARLAEAQAIIAAELKARDQSGKRT